MKVHEFESQAWMSLLNICSLHICIVQDCGEDYVYSAFFDNEGQIRSKITKSKILYTKQGKPYFNKNRVRYYLDDFIKSSIG